MRNFKIVVLSALVAVSGFANAQTGLKPVGVSIYGGGFFPVQSDARNVGTAWLGFGAEYRLADLSAHSPNVYKAGVALSIDYFGKNGFSSVPVLLNYVASMGETGALFYEAGIGAGFTHTPSESKTRLAYQLGVGYQFQSDPSLPLFAEVKFLGSEKSDLNGFGAYVGVRF